MSNSHLPQLPTCFTWSDEHGRRLWDEAAMAEYALAAVAAHTVVAPEAMHPDDLAVDRFAAAKTDAARDVLAERQRQVSAEGWTSEHDDEHDSEKMAIAAACYAESAGGYHHPRTVPSNWPWPSKWWKPTTPRRNLVKAGALILAEIERIDRAASSTVDQ